MFRIGTGCNCDTPEQILISIAAGISIADITSIVKNTSKIVRVMPNTPALVGSGISAICVGNELSDNENGSVQHF